jgi:hypothetical protein
MKNKNNILFVALIYSQLAFSEDVHESPVPTNQDVLKEWKDTSGQAATIDGTKLEWHGQATVDAYNVDTQSNQTDGALSGLQEGTFSLTRLQGDLRDIEQAGDVNYIQGGVSVTRDRAIQNLYSSYITNLQLGRAGAGYQISAGDVVANFSKIGSNLGLRGLYANKQVNGVVFDGYAGVVTESWDSLFDRTTLAGLSPRTRFLRDVGGFRANYSLNERWSIFGTAQGYSDRKSSLSEVQQVLQIQQTGRTGTAGIGYKNERANLVAEIGTSNAGYDLAGAKLANFNNAAFLIDGTYAWQTVNLHAGYHNIGAFYTSLSSNVVPGVRESYVGAEWLISPSLGYANDLRYSETKTGDLAGGTSPINLVQSLTNRLTYNVTQMPGLNFSLQDTRNWGEVEINRARNATTQFGVTFANQKYSANASLSNSRQATNTDPSSSSVTDAIQLSLGRQAAEGELIALPSISGGIQFIAGYQQQHIANGTKTYSFNEGVALNTRSQKLGQIQLGLTNLDTHQPNGRPKLNTITVNLDWSKAVINGLVLKGYVRNNYRNHGDSIQAVDEKVVGFQGDYQW